MNEAPVKMETAQTLSALGFTKPKANGGQLWYEGTRTIEIIDEGENLRLVFSWENMPALIPKSKDIDTSRWYIAPDYKEIKAQIEEKYPVNLSGGETVFICAVEVGANEELYSGENFGEACAKAWITLKKREIL